ncbi:unnamed protein product [Xylocopa violacea]|uniref:DEK-C domain-containing protein n=1 Tax=Xylocopa violacea TaxID=135666 RepID=A0ABP1NX04_XYLVO
MTSHKRTRKNRKPRKQTTISKQSRRLEEMRQIMIDHMEKLQIDQQRDQSSQQTAIETVRYTSNPNVQRTAIQSIHRAAIQSSQQMIQRIRQPTIQSIRQSVVQHIEQPAVQRLRPPAIQTVQQATIRDVQQPATRSIQQSLHTISSWSAYYSNQLANECTGSPTKSDISTERLRREITSILKVTDTAAMSISRIKSEIETKLNIDLTGRKREVSRLAIECLREKQAESGQEKRVYQIIRSPISRQLRIVQQEQRKADPIAVNFAPRLPVTQNNREFQIHRERISKMTRCFSTRFRGSQASVVKIQPAVPKMYRLLAHGCKKTNFTANNVSTEELCKEINGILKGSDLTTVSARKVRSQIEEKLGVDLSGRKREVDTLVMKSIQEHYRPRVLA